MKIEAACSNPDDVEFTISMTATLWEWERLRQTMHSNAYCSSKATLSDQIINLTTQFAHAKYMPKAEETDDV